MAQRPILQYPDPRLRERSAPVTAFDAGLEQLVDDLLDTLFATDAIGLSAPQIDDRRRVLVTDPTAERTDPQIYVNPEITGRAMPGIVEESCLSLPGVVGNVIRRTRVRVRAQDRAGAPFERELEGMAAVSLQHEIDHLDGKLFIDRLSPIRRLLFFASQKAKARRATG